MNGMFAAVNAKLASVTAEVPIRLSKLLSLMKSAN